jgi:hypothetical protein
MSVTVKPMDANRFSTDAKRLGYAVSIGVNVLLLVVVNNLLGWGWFPWLTPAFEDLLPVINLALVVNIVLGLLYMFYDEQRFKAVAQIVVNLIAIVVLIRTWQVYPFDFSGHDFPVEISAFDLTWDVLVRFLIGVAIFGVAIAIVTETMKLFRKPDRT